MATPVRAAAPAQIKIPLGDEETIVFFGDSITQQNLYTAYIETFLIARFPCKRLLFWNAGIGGNKVDEALTRFDRDVAPLKPTIVVVNFGMNDGKYVPPDAAIRLHYKQGLQALVAKIRNVGARPLLCTPPAANSFFALYLEHYNETLAGLAEAVKEVAREQKLPVIDLFSAFRPFAEQASPSPVLIPDGVHPNEAGHLVLAAPALQAFDAPKELGTIVVDGHNVTGSKGVSVANTTRKPGQLSFAAQLAYVPLFLPPVGRKGEAVKVAQAWNRLRMQVKSWPSRKNLRLLVDGHELAVLPPNKRGDVDLANLPEAPWNKASADLWREAQRRSDLQSTSWRTLGIDVSDLSKTLDTTPLAQQSLHLWAKEAGLAMRTLVQPKTYNVSIEETDEVFIEALELSPVYLFDLSPASFDQAHPPETDPQSVSWRKEPVVSRALDLETALDHPKKTVVYARLILDAASDGQVDMQLGSNDGLSVFVNGTRVLARNVSRGLKLGDDSVVASLKKGRNVVLFRVTQHELRHGLAMQLRALNGLQVQQVLP